MSKSLKTGRYLIVVYMIYMKNHASYILHELNMEKKLINFRPDGSQREETCLGGRADQVIARAACSGTGTS